MNNSYGRYCFQSLLYFSRVWSLSTFSLLRVITAKCYNMMWIKWSFTNSKITFFFWASLILLFSQILYWILIKPDCPSIHDWIISMFFIFLERFFVNCSLFDLVDWYWSLRDHNSSSDRSKNHHFFTSLLYFLLLFNIKPSSSAFLYFSDWIYTLNYSL